MKLRRICDTLPSSVTSGGRSAGLLEDQRHGVADQQRAQHAAQRAEQVGDAELGRRDHDLAGLDLGEVEQVVDQLGQVLRRLADELDLLLLLGASARRRCRVSSSRDSARIEFSGVRNSWLMLDRKRVFSSSARRRWSARSSSSA